MKPTHKNKMVTAVGSTDDLVRQPIIITHDSKAGYAAFDKLKKLLKNPKTPAEFHKRFR